eukprot:jgi/Astpho2/150/Aster-x0895
MLATAASAVKRTRVRPRNGAELTRDPSPRLTEPRPTSISQLAAEIKPEVLEGSLENIQGLSRDVRQHATEEAAQLDPLAPKLQLFTAGQAQQPLTTGVNGASLAPASPVPKPKRRGRQPAAEQAPAPVLTAAAAPKPRRCGRQPAAEQAPEGGASVVKLARQKPAKPRATPKAGVAALAEPEAGLLMLQREPFIEQQGSARSAAPPNVAGEASRNLIILGIDPDSSGAIAALQWHLPSSTQAGKPGQPGGSSGRTNALLRQSTAQVPDLASTSSGAATAALKGLDQPETNGSSGLAQLAEHSTQLSLQGATAEVMDIPCQLHKVGARSRRQGQHVTGQTDPQQVAVLVQGLLQRFPGAQIRAVLEEPLPGSMNGKFSWYSSGYTAGIWQGVLLSCGVPFASVTARRWKADLLLNGLGKEGSRLLAQRVFPQTTPLLKRKKDHGRAEAMLIAAWGVGLRLNPLAPDANLEDNFCSAALEAEALQDDVSF